MIQSIKGYQFYLSQKKQNPSGLMFSGTLLSVKPRKSSQIYVPAINTTEHDIILPNRTLIGCLQLIQSVTLVDVKLRKESESTTQSVEPAAVMTIQQDSGKTGELPQHLKDISMVGLTEEQKEMATALLVKEQDSFAKDDSDIGSIKHLKLAIRLKDETPVQKNYVVVPRPLYQEVKSYIEDLNRNFICKSTSPYSSPVVCVRKKDKSLHLCIDYCALNQKTIPDRHLIPRIQEALDSLGGNTWLSVLDQGKAYHQGYMSETSQPLTAFITPWGLYEWIRIPFGLCNAPGGYQWFMESCLGDLRDDICIPYLNDVIVFSSLLKDPIDHLRRVLRCLREHGVKPKLKKCNLFKREATFLGRIVSKDGYKLDPPTIDPVLNLKKTVPKTAGDVHKLVGLLSYYHHYIQDFSRIAKPIYDLLSFIPDRDGVKQIKPKTMQDTKLAQIPSNAPVSWNDEHQSAVEYLIDCLTKPPIMAYPDFNSPSSFTLMLLNWA